jgi:glycosyltransferase involved in cell wall biosynthesis
VSDDKLSDTIIALLTNDAKREELEQRGLARSRDYSWTEVGAKYVETFSKVISAKAKS